MWSETNSEAKAVLKPDLGLRSWDDLTSDEKYLMWKYMEPFFFESKVKYDSSFGSRHVAAKDNEYYQFDKQFEDETSVRIVFSIVEMFHTYKAKCFTKGFVDDNSVFTACEDFYEIFQKEKGHVVLELLSYYCKAVFDERDGKYPYTKQSNQTKGEFEEQKRTWEMSEFVKFQKALNEVLVDFGLNVYLTVRGFVPKQDDKIMDDIYEPVLKCLAGEKWRKVNELLTDAFSSYRANTPQGYSTCVTHAVSTIQAFLQVVVHGKTGDGDLAKLIGTAQKNGLIPGDAFTRDIFKSIDSFLMRERKETGDPHPKTEYSNEKNAKLVLNLVMVFIQHCLV